MADSGKQSTLRSPNRRQFMKTVGATGAVFTVAGCSGDSGSGDGGSGDGGGGGDGGDGGDGGGGDGDGGGDGGDGGSTGGSDSVTVELFMPGDSVQSKDTLTTRLREVGLPERISLKWTAQPEYAQLKDRVQQTFTSGGATPDVIFTPHQWIAEWAARDYLAPFDGVVPDETITRVKENFAPFSVRASTLGDNMYAASGNVSVPFIYYRKDLVEEAGHGSEVSEWATNPPSYKRFTEVVESTWKNAGTEYGLLARMTGPQLTWNEWMQAVRAHGGSLYGGYDNAFGGPDAVGDRPITFNEEPGVRTTAMFRSWVQGDHEDYPKICDPAVLQWGYSNLDQLFVAGDGVFNIHWPSSAPKYEEEFGDRYGVMSVPWGVEPENAKYDGYGGPICSSSAWNYTINANSEHKQAAGQVVKALTQPEFLVTHFEIAGNIPPSPAALDTEAVRDTTIGRHVDVIETELESAMTFPVTPVWGQSMTKAEQNIKSAMKGDMSPQEAMDQTNKAIEQIENNFSG